MFLQFLLIQTLLTYYCDAAVLLWSKSKLEISPLVSFGDNNLEDLVKNLGSPEVIIYKSPISLLPEFEDLLDGFHTAYTPNGLINTENATEIAGQEDLLLLEAKNRLDLSKNSSILSVIVFPNKRYKREVASSTTESLPIGSKGPILYRGKTTKNIYSLVYSSQPLILKTSNMSIELGESTLVTIDKQNKNSTSRLDARVSYGDEKFVLQFFFTWHNTYWSLMNVRVKSTLNTSFINSTINLTISDPFSVPRRFSYHCSGVTSFSDVDKSTELLIFDMQVQPDSKDGTFGDVYDCVDFTTVPIWSGLLISGLLGIGLIIALLAISEIKTMDKFDNQKTKQLAITVAE